MTDKVRQMRLQQSIGEFEIFRDEDTLERVLGVVTGDPAYSKWQQETIQTASLTTPDDPQSAAERFTGMLTAYSKRYQHFFEDTEAFEEFQKCLIEKQKDLYLRVHKNLLENYESEEYELNQSS